MEHFYQNIQGWAIYIGLYREMVGCAPTHGAHFVEIGSWKGRSAAFMGVEIYNSGKKIKFDCIDTWDGGPDLQHRKQDLAEDMLVQFQRNTAKVKEQINPIRMKSVEAAKLYEDGSVDFLMIDGSHVYEDVKADIIAWLPKIKKGGVISGDDYNWSGVKQAVKELLPQAQVIVMPRAVPSYRNGKLLSDPSYWRVQC